MTRVQVLATEASYLDDVLQRLADIKEYLDHEQDIIWLTLWEKISYFISFVL